MVDILLSTGPLTAGIDAVAASATNDTINSVVSGALSALDNIDGGAGTDTLNVTDTAAIAVSTSAVIKNVEIAKLVSAATVSANVSGWTGLNSVTVAEVGGGTITAATTTVATIVDSAQAAGTITINGGSNVSLTSVGATTGAVSVGATVAAAGDVSVSRTTSGAVSAGSISVNGGKTISVTQAASNAVNTTQVNGTVAVTGDANTATVTVASAAAATASATVAGITANTVSITDVNNGSATKAGTITSASVSGYTTLGINDNALTSLSLTNGSGNIIIANNGLTTATNKTLNLTLNAVTGGTLDDADIYTTLNVTTAGVNSTLANITLGAATALTVAGTKGLTLTSTAGLTALKTVTVSGAAGVTGNFSAATVTAVDTSATTGASTVSIDATLATFTGGAGVDKVTTTAAAPSKAISLGAGDDSLTLAAGTTTVTGAISGGDGVDTLSIAAADAATAGATATFATKVTGFEKLVLTGATNQTIDLSVLGAYNNVTTSGGSGLTLNNMSSAGTLVLNGAGTAYTVANNAFLVATNDSLNLTLTDGSTAAVAFAATGVTATNVEAIAITVVDTQTTPTGTFNDSLTLLGNSAKSITVAGNAGLTLTAASTAATTVDASGISLGGFTFTSGVLAAAATIKGSATGTNTIDFSAATGVVTYTGGSGADAVTASNTKANIISLGDGTNSVTGTSGNMTITGGINADTVGLTTGNNTVNLGNGANAFTATTGNNTYIGGTGVDTVTVGGGVNNITTGTGADVISFTGVIANGNSYSTITDAHAGLKLVFADDGQSSGTSTFSTAKITLADTAAFQDFLDAAAAGAGTVTNSNLSWFQFGGNTYVVEDNSAATTFQNAGDTLVKLTGVYDVSTATFAAIAATSASLTLV